MRIISGKYKGRRITAPKNLPVRPTTDMSKEALFNVLNNHYEFEDLKVLDLFAGTGNISYEFASRGVKNITCVDGDTGCVRFIKETAKQYDFPIAAVKSDVIQYLQRNTNSYSLIFADPPYGFEQKTFEEIVNLVFEKNSLWAEGMLVIEHSKFTKLDHLPHFSFMKSYGGSIFSFFNFEEEIEEAEESEIKLESK